MQTFFDWFTEGKIGLILAGVPLFWSALQYLSIRKREAKQREFEIYHKLIQNIVEGEHPHRDLKADRQIAAIFELRGFPFYYPVSLRILRGLKGTWAESARVSPGVARVVAEVDIAIRVLERKLRWRCRAAE